MQLSEALLWTGLWLLSIIPMMLGFRVLKATFRFLFKRHYYTNLPKRNSLFSFFYFMQDKKTYKFYENDRPELEDQDLVYFGFHLDGSHIVGVYDSELIGHVLKNPETFRKSPMTYEAIKCALGSGVLTSEDEAWANQRRILAPLFNLNLLRKHTAVVVDRTLDTIEKIKLFNNQNSGKQQSIHKKIFNETTQAIINSYCFGDRFDAG
jgi:cytochrome P450